MAFLFSSRDTGWVSYTLWRTTGMDQAKGEDVVDWSSTTRMCELQRCGCKSLKKKRKYVAKKTTQLHCKIEQNVKDDKLAMYVYTGIRSTLKIALLVW